MGMEEEERAAGRGGGTRGGRGAAPLAFSFRCGKTFRVGTLHGPPPPLPASSRGQSRFPLLSSCGAETQAWRSGSWGTKVPLAPRSWLTKYVSAMGGGGSPGGRRKGAFLAPAPPATGPFGGGRRIALEGEWFTMVARAAPG